MGERVEEKSKCKRQSAKLRDRDVVGMAVFIAGSRQKVDLGGRGRRGETRDDGGGTWGWGWIGFELGLFFWGRRADVFA